LYIKTCVEPINDLYLMLWTGNDCHCSVLYRNDRLIWIMGCEVATRTVDTAGWSMIYEFSCVLGSESTDRGELLKVFITSNKGECELIHEKVGYCVTSVRVESRLARITLDRRMTMEVVRLLLGGICWGHTEVCSLEFSCHTGKLWEPIGVSSILLELGEIDILQDIYVSKFLDEDYDQDTEYNYCASIEVHSFSNRFSASNRSPLNTG
jgi:hypothetical protein